MSLEHTLNAKHGPLKTWQWAGLLTSAVVIGLILRARAGRTATASAQTVDPATSDQGAIDPWTGIPYSQEALAGGGAPGVSGGSGSVDTTTDPADTTVPVTMDAPDWYTNPPYWWTVPGTPAATTQDTPADKTDAKTGGGAGSNSARATHRQVAPRAISSSPQRTASSDATLHVNPANNEHYETITKDHKVYHYYPNRSGSSKYVYIRPATR